MGSLIVERYLDQKEHWPAEGRHVLAQYDEATVVVYQAYRPEIAAYAVAHGRLGGEGFSYERMSWVKTNFLWMMFRSGWGTKPNQESTLALRVSRAFFDGLIAQAVPSSWDREAYPDRAAWEEAVRKSDVRSQWDPDHHPSGAKLPRRAIQLGLRGEALRAFGTREVVEVIDVSAFVAKQRELLATRGLGELVTPREKMYPGGR